MERIEAGLYRTVINGDEVKVIHYSHYGSKESLWNLVMNGICESSFITKKEALEYAITHLTKE